MTNSTRRCYEDMPPELVGYDSSVHLHIDSADTAEAVHRTVVDYFWPRGGLPTQKLPAVSPASGAVWTPEGDLAGLAASNAAQAQRLDTVVDFGYGTHSYLLSPINPARADRLVIVHAGHAPCEKLWANGVGPLIDHLLTNGFSVLAMQMPMYGWHQRDVTLELPDGPAAVSTHSDFVDALEAAPGGSAMRFFIEPVVQGINYFISRGVCKDISMIGLSGGGWTTHVAPAVDQRICLSIPVAGSHPMYVRRAYNAPGGDHEQDLPALYEERASWMDIYVLSGFGPGRVQIQVLNQYDECCFYGVAHTTYADNVRRAVAATGAGQWDFYLDTTHRLHQISLHVVSNVIDPALGLDGSKSGIS